MKSGLYVNLFLKSEMRSPAPVRLRVMAPVMAAAAAATMAVMAFILHSVNISTDSELSLIAQEGSQLEPRFKEALLLKAQADNLKSALRQLEQYRNARLEWREALLALPAQVPEGVQFVEFKYSYTFPPLAPPGNQLIASTNRIETAKVEISGRTLASASVDDLMVALKQPPFAEFFLEAKVPPGAFRLDARSEASELDVRLFEIKAVSDSRRFE